MPPCIIDAHVRCVSQGIFPKCYVRLKPAFREIRGNQISIVPKEDPITEEAKNILREWHDLWKDLFSVSTLNIIHYTLYSVI